VPGRVLGHDSRGAWSCAGPWLPRCLVVCWAMTPAVPGRVLGHDSHGAWSCAGQSSTRCSAVSPVLLRSSICSCVTIVVIFLRLYKSNFMIFGTSVHDVILRPTSKFQVTVVWTTHPPWRRQNINKSSPHRKYVTLTRSGHHNGTMLGFIYVCKCCASGAVNMAA